VKHLAGLLRRWADRLDPESRVGVRVDLFDDRGHLVHRAIVPVCLTPGLHVTGRGVFTAPCPTEIVRMWAVNPATRQISGEKTFDPHRLRAGDSFDFTVDIAVGSEQPT